MHRQGTGLRCPVVDPRVRTYGFSFDLEGGQSCQSVWCAALKCAATDPPGQDTAAVDVLITLSSYEWTMYGWSWDDFPPEQWTLERELTFWVREPPCQHTGSDWSATTLCRVTLEDNEEGQSIGYQAQHGLGGLGETNDDLVFVPKADTNIGVNWSKMRSVKSLLGIPSKVNTMDLLCMWLAVACGATTVPVSAEYSSYRDEFEKMSHWGSIPGNMEYRLEIHDRIQTGYTGNLASLPADSLQALMDSLGRTRSRKTNLGELASVPAARKGRADEKYLDPTVAGWSGGDVSAQLHGNNRYLIGLELENKLNAKHKRTVSTALQCAPSAAPHTSEAFQKNLMDSARLIEEILNLEVYTRGDKVTIFLPGKGLRFGVGCVQEYVRSKAQYVVELDYDSSFHSNLSARSSWIEHYQVVSTGQIDHDSRFRLIYVEPKDLRRLAA